MNSFTYIPLTNSFTYIPLMNSFTYIPLMKSFTYIPLMNSLTYIHLKNLFTYIPLMNSFTYIPLTNSFTYIPLTNSPIFTSRTYSPIFPSWTYLALLSDIFTTLTCLTGGTLVSSFQFRNSGCGVGPVGARCRVDGASRAVRVGGTRNRNAGVWLAVGSGRAGLTVNLTRIWLVCSWNRIYVYMYILLRYKFLMSSKIDVR